MASTGPTQLDSVTETSAPQEITNVPSRQTNEAPLSSTPLEMTTLESKPDATTGTPTNASSTMKENEPTSQPTAYQAATSDPLVKTPTTASAGPGTLDRKVSTAIGPSSDQPIPIAKDTETTGPSLMITLLLTSGARHPFKLDSKYLNKRNVKVADNDPFNLSVYTLKELILREWRDGMLNIPLCVNTAHMSQNGNKNRRVRAPFD